MLIFREQIFESLFGIQAHGADFVHFEMPAVFSDAGLRKKNGATIFDPNGEGDQCEQRRQERQADKARDNIEGAFQKCRTMGVPFGTKPLLLDSGIEKEPAEERLS